MEQPPSPLKGELVVHNVEIVQKGGLDKILNIKY